MENTYSLITDAWEEVTVIDKHIFESVQKDDIVTFEGKEYLVLYKDLDMDLKEFSVVCTNNKT